MSKPETCRNGHERTPENTAIRKDGNRDCRECARASLRRLREKKKAAREAMVALLLGDMDLPTVDRERAEDPFLGAPCRSDNPERWWPDAVGRPVTFMQVHARELCNGCPAIRHCARRALDLNASSGVWAGVWIPPTSLDRREARKRLSAIASPPSPSQPVKERRESPGRPPVNTGICIGCGVSTLSSKHPLPIPENMRRYGGRGLCSACHKRLNRRENAMKDNDE